MKNIINRRRSRRSGDNRGFSLVELTIALALFAILALVVSMIVAATFQENMNNIRRNKQADTHDYAYRLGVSGNAGYASGYANVDGASGTLQANFSGYGFTNDPFDKRYRFKLYASGKGTNVMKGHMPFFDIVDGAATIKSFRIDDNDGVIVGGSITVTVPNSTDVTKLTPVIVYSGSGISPASGAETDFTASVPYTVTAADGTTAVYTVTVTKDISVSP